MWNRHPVNTAYFCGNCEDEVSGLPSGTRVYSGRPLCFRCTQIGVEEGWAREQVLEPDKRIYETSRKPGIIVLLLFASVLGFVLWAMLMAFGRSR